MLFTITTHTHSHTHTQSLDTRILIIMQRCEYLFVCHLVFFISLAKAHDTTNNSRWPISDGSNGLAMSEAKIYCTRKTFGNVALVAIIRTHTYNSTGKFDARTPHEHPRNVTFMQYGIQHRCSCCCCRRRSANASNAECVTHTHTHADSVYFSQHHFDSANVRNCVTLITRPK